MLDDETAKALREKLQTLILEHRDLDDVVGRLTHDPAVDQLQLKRMKKRKLQLKDMIIHLRSRLIPDIEA